ncbi:MAG: peptidase T [Candidatus Heimdallarchaeum aukensis]|uniref:Peptidase T n=1 Tax=Candidatus Heimdallarchaeum aukensis TaxID=2876573 RepID=A0A9Y1FKK6_9ARCH|nr:MAG: peptidase T [Candidatus Heimdallarchaeum aukensis]
MINEEMRKFILNDSVERFIKYVQVETTSDENSSSNPSTKEQLELGKILVQELESLGLKEVELDEFGYVYATLPASEGYENVEPIGLIAHIDTSPAVSGKNVKPIVHKKYDGGTITFPKDPELTLSKEDSKELEEYVGLDIITASGDTLLGADDKAGVAEIMTAISTWQKYPSLNHGEIKICFTPDEEVGRGTEKINKERLPKYCYTFDGGEMGELETECFDAWSVKLTFVGLSVHPGYAKNKMINAIDVACRFFSQIPEYETPERTEKREGFYHLHNLSGNAEIAEGKMIIRDFNVEKNEKRIDYIKSLISAYERRYPGLKIELEYKHSYENMKVYLEPHKHIVDHAEKAIERAGLEVKYTAIRGGTDGARLSAQGIPTPNIFAGGLLFHSRKEYIPTLAIQKAVEVIIYLADEWTKKTN